MKNFVQDGKAIDVVTPSGGYVSGGFYVLGKLAGIAALTSAEGESNVLHTEGVYALPKATGAAWAIGDKLYWSGTNFTKTASTNVAYGIAAAVAGTADAVGKVKLCHIPAADA